MADRPDFIIAGAAKSGATTIWRWLSTHPDIFMPAVDEAGFFSHWDRPAHPAAGPFNAADCARAATDWDGYRALFRPAGRRIAGEASPIYLMDPAAPARIAARLPAAQVILVLREPVARAFAQFAHHLRDGLETTGDFAAALGAEADRLARGWSLFHGYAWGGRYATQLANLWRHLPRARTLVILHEDLEARPEESWRRLCRFIGVSDAHLPDFAHRVDRRAGLSAAPRPGGLACALKAGRQRLNAGPRPRLDPAAAARLSAGYSAEIDALERMIGRDLSGWRAAWPAPAAPRRAVLHLAEAAS